METANTRAGPLNISSRASRRAYATNRALWGPIMADKQNLSDEEVAVRDLIEAWADAVRRKDYHGILRSQASDFVMFDVPPPFKSVGLDAYRKTWDLFFSWSSDPVRFDIQELDVAAGVDVAFAFASMRCEGPVRRQARRALFSSDNGPQENRRAVNDCARTSLGPGDGLRLNAFPGTYSSPAYRPRAVLTYPAACARQPVRRSHVQPLV